MIDTLHSRLAVATDVVTRAGAAARGVQRRLDQVRELTKDDRSPVTVADFAVQAIVAMALYQEDPTAMIVGEERADVLRQPDHASYLEAVVEAVRSVNPDATADDVLAAIDSCDHDASGDDGYWALDPIDGTKGFLRGQQYAIALGRIEAGRVVAGVMGCPNLARDPAVPIDPADDTGCVYVAAAGRGVFVVSEDGTTTRVERPAFDPSVGGGRVRVCESVESAHTRHSATARIMDELGIETTPVRLDSQCKYAVVARGQADAYLRLPTKKGYVEKIWDHAAGSVIATEAGAVVSDITGAPLDFSRGTRLETNRGVVCAAAGLHERVIEAIDRLGV